MLCYILFISQTWSYVLIILQRVLKKMIQARHKSRKFLVISPEYSLPILIFSTLHVQKDHSFFFSFLFFFSQLTLEGRIKIATTIKVASYFFWFMADRCTKLGCRYISFVNTRSFKILCLYFWDSLQKYPDTSFLFLLPSLLLYYLS